MTEIVDVSLALYDNMGTFPAPTHVETELKDTGTHEEEGMAVSKLKTSTHTGTHIDSPYHFVAEGRKLDEISPDRFIRPAVLLDFSHKEAKGGVTAAELEEKNVSIDEGDIVIIRTDWTDKMEGKSGFFMESPYLEPDAARWLVGKNISGFGLDAGNVENPDKMDTDKAAEIHKILLGAGLIIIEGLTNLSQIPEGRHEIFALPLKLNDCEGAPARVMIRVNEIG